MKNIHSFYLRPVKHVLFSMLFLFTSLMLLQIDFPNSSEISERFNHFFIEKQLILNREEKGPTLKEGWFYYNLGDYNQSRDIMEPIAQTGDSSALYCLGLIDLKDGNAYSGINKLERVLGLSPKHTPTMYQLAKAYYKERYYIKSIGLLEKLLEYEPTNQTARLLLGRTYVKTGKNEKAVKIFKTVTGENETHEAAAILKTLNQEIY